MSATFQGCAFFCLPFPHRSAPNYAQCKHPHPPWCSATNRAGGAEQHLLAGRGRSCSWLRSHAETARAPSAFLGNLFQLKPVKRLTVRRGPGGTGRLRWRAGRGPFPADPRAKNPVCYTARPGTAHASWRWESHEAAPNASLLLEKPTSGGRAVSVTFLDIDSGQGLAVNGCIDLAGLSGAPASPPDIVPAETGH